MPALPRRGCTACDGRLPAAGIGIGAVSGWPGAGVWGPGDAGSATGSDAGASAKRPRTIVVTAGSRASFSPGAWVSTAAATAAPGTRTASGRATTSTPPSTDSIRATASGTAAEPGAPAGRTNAGPGATNAAAATAYRAPAACAAFAARSPTALRAPTQSCGADDACRPVETGGAHGAETPARRGRATHSGRSRQAGNAPLVATAARRRLRAPAGA